MFIINAIFFVPHKKFYRILDVKSPLEFVLDKKIFKLENLETFDSKFTARNKELANKLNITEEEAFVLGNLGKYWTANLMQGRLVFIKDNSDLIFVKYSYRQKFLHSAFCIQNGNITNPKGLEYRLKQIRKDSFRVLNLDNGNIYKITDREVRELENFLVLRKSQLPKTSITKKKTEIFKNTIYSQGDIKIILSDFTENLKPTRECSTEICKEILRNINSAQKTIDMAIYGYSNVPAIENALKSAISRGVKIRLVCDSDKNGNNIYENTNEFKSEILSLILLIFLFI